MSSQLVSFLENQAGMKTPETNHYSIPHQMRKAAPEKSEPQSQPQAPSTVTGDAVGVGNTEA